MGHALGDTTSIRDAHRLICRLRRRADLCGGWRSSRRKADPHREPTCLPPPRQQINRIGPPLPRSSATRSTGWRARFPASPARSANGGRFVRTGGSKPPGGYRRRCYVRVISERRRCDRGFRVHTHIGASSDANISESSVAVGTPSCPGRTSLHTRLRRLVGARGGGRGLGLLPALERRRSTAWCTTRAVDGQHASNLREVYRLLYQRRCIRLWSSRARVRARVNE